MLVLFSFTYELLQFWLKLYRRIHQVCLERNWKAGEKAADSYQVSKSCLKSKSTSREFQGVYENIKAISFYSSFEAFWSELSVLTMLFKLDTVFLIFNLKALHFTWVILINQFPLNFTHRFFMNCDLPNISYLWNQNLEVKKTEIST